ncbi:NblA/ycf18 family protein [Laspinema sp. D1]|uniref:NblA/ycf18 family protein n=2 Tax=Laspinema TaxID=2584823 RepID=A0ABT2MJZ2_9CYAN|nr:NblA/ycf18 family protein [Laspinema sp. D2a]
MNLEQTQFFLKQMYKQMMVKEAMYQQFLREKWKIK